MKQEVRRRIEQGRNLARLREMRTSAAKGGAKRDYSSSLEYIARPFGGRAGMVDLARGCSDRRIRQTVHSWDRLGPTERKYTTLAQLCEVHGIEEAEFLSAVIASLWRSGVDVTPLVRRCFRTSVGRRAALDASVQQDRGTRAERVPTCMLNTL